MGLGKTDCFAPATIRRVTLKIPFMHRGVPKNCRQVSTSEVRSRWLKRPTKISLIVILLRHLRLTPRGIARGCYSTSQIQEQAARTAIDLIKIIGTSSDVEVASDQSRNRRVTGPGTGGSHSCSVRWRKCRESDGGSVRQHYCVLTGLDRSTCRPRGRDLVAGGRCGDRRREMRRTLLRRYLVP